MVVFGPAMAWGWLVTELFDFLISLQEGTSVDVYSRGREREIWWEEQMQKRTKKKKRQRSVIY